ncbi:hypothetical protein RUND412_009831 [Rhizina undulata]
MDTLPTEILLDIGSYLTGADTSSLRLVNRKLSATATILKSQALHVRATLRRLDNLVNISRQPALAQCVREITYPYDCLAQMCKQPCFGEVEWPGRGEIALLNSSLPSEVRRLAKRKAYTSDLRKWCTIRKSISCTKEVRKGDEQAMKVVMDLVNTTHRLGFKLDRFGRRGAGVWREFFTSGSYLHNCASLLQNLTSVYFCITTSPRDHDSYEDIEALKKDAKEDQIFKLFSCSPNLRTLSLELNDMVRRVKFLEIPLLDLLGRGYVWKYLHTFNLKVFTPVNPHDLENILGRHAVTLKCIRLGFPMLPSGTWREIMDFLKERLDLTDLKLDHPREKHRHGGFFPRYQYRIYGIEAQRTMENYVLRGGGPFPPTHMELEENRWEMTTFFGE